MVSRPRIPVKRPIQFFSRTFLDGLACDGLADGFLAMVFMSMTRWMSGPAGRRGIRDFVALLEQLSGARGLGFGIVVNGCERFAGSDLVSNFLVQHDADGRIDGIFFALAAAAENHAGGADLLALQWMPRIRPAHWRLPWMCCACGRRLASSMTRASPPCSSTIWRNFSSAWPDEINLRCVVCLPRRISIRRRDATSSRRVRGRVRASLAVRRRATLPLLRPLRARCRSCCRAADPCR